MCLKTTDTPLPALSPTTRRNPSGKISKKICPSDDSTRPNLSQDKESLALDVLLNDSAGAVWEDVEDSGTDEDLSQDRQYPSPGTSLTETPLLKLENI